MRQRRVEEQSEGQSQMDTRDTVGKGADEQRNWGRRCSEAGRTAATLFPIKKRHAADASNKSLEQKRASIED